MTLLGPATGRDNDRTRDAIAHLRARGWTVRRIADDVGRCGTVDMGANTITTYEYPVLRYRVQPPDDDAIECNDSMVRAIAAYDAGWTGED